MRRASEHKTLLTVSNSVKAYVPSYTPESKVVHSVVSWSMVLLYTKTKQSEADMLHNTPRE